MNMYIDCVHNSTKMILKRINCIHFKYKVHTKNVKKGPDIRLEPYI